MKRALTLVLLAAAGIGLATAASAADLPTTPVVETPMATPAGNWDGFYAGFNLGYASGNADHIGTTIGDAGIVGWLLGGQVGYNHTLSNNIVLGVQGDLDWTNITGTYAPFPTVTQTINWEGSVTAHLGYDAGAFMPYLLGGFAFANGDRTSTIGPTTENGTHMGYTVGVGAAAKVSDTVSLFGEVRYNNFGTHTYTTLPSSPEVSLTSTEARVGLNFHF